MSAALEKQKAALDELAEKKLEWALRNKEREMQQELGYEVQPPYPHPLISVP